MKTYYKVYSVGNDAQPSHVSDSDASVIIFRKQNPIDGAFNNSPIRIYNDKFHGIQRSEQQHSIDSISNFNDNETIILRNINHDIDRDFNKLMPILAKHYIVQYQESNFSRVYINRNIKHGWPLQRDKCAAYTNIQRYSYGLLGAGTQERAGINKKYTIDFKASSCNVIDSTDDILLKQYALLYKAWHCDIYNLNYLYHTQDYSVPLKDNYARTRVIYPAKPLTHIFKEYSCNVVYTPINYNKNLSSKQSAKFKYKKTAESTRQRAFKTFSALVDNKLEKDLNTASTTVIQKTDVVIDSSIGDFSLMVQKMEFFELKLEKVANVTDLPEGVEYKNDSIKGSIANSGEYFINVKYNNDATQIINIIVPFYRRLL